MSRSIIGGIVAVIITALTATAYFVTTSSQEDKVQKDLRDRVGRAVNQLRQSATIEGLGVLRKAESLASSQRLVEALNAQKANDYKTMKTQADLAFSEFLANEKGSGEIDLALVNAAGDVMFMNGAPVPTAGQFKDDKGQVNVPALAEALSRRVVISEIGRLPGAGLARIAAAPVIDHEASAVASAESGEEKVVIVGAVLAAFPITAKAATDQDALLGVRVAYFDGTDKVSATSFKRGNEENTGMQEHLRKALESSGLRAKAFDEQQPDASKPGKLEVDGTPYLAATVRLPRFNTKPLPESYARQDVGALVLISAASEASAFTKPAKTFILLLGIGSLVIALFGMYLVHRRLESQIDQIELGVAEIINGNLERTFQPVGKELDGLANGLNVMLARLLGRPEPGEEEFDENGNPVIPGKVDFEEAPEGAAPPQMDADLAALAQEAEPDYYKRVFTEYGEARRQAGSPDDVSFESFIAKLRVNEGKLKAQYQCRQVRFRVVLKDGKVSLKPVPIF